MPSNFMSFFRFCVIGVLNTLLTYLVHALLYRFVGPHLAIVAGYIAGLLNSYKWNTNWTFRMRLAGKGKLSRFFGVNVLLLGLNETGYSLLILVFHSPLITQAVNSVLMAVIGYLANRSFVFSPTKEREVKS